MVLNELDEDAYFTVRDASEHVNCVAFDANNVTDALRGRVVVVADGVVVQADDAGRDFSTKSLAFRFALDRSRRWVFNPQLPIVREVGRTPEGGLILDELILSGTMHSVQECIHARDTPKKECVGVAGGNRPGIEVRLFDGASKATALAALYDTGATHSSKRGDDKISLSLDHATFRKHQISSAEHGGGCRRGDVEYATVEAKVHMRDLVSDDIIEVSAVAMVPSTAASESSRSYGSGGSASSSGGAASAPASRRGDPQGRKAIVTFDALLGKA